MFGIADQFNGQVMLSNEFAVTGFRIRTHPDNFGIQGRELRQFFAKGDRLGGAAGGIILGIKIEN